MLRFLMVFISSTAYIQKTMMYLCLSLWTTPLSLHWVMYHYMIFLLPDYMVHITAEWQLLSFIYWFWRERGRERERETEREGEGEGERNVKFVVVPLIYAFTGILMCALTIDRTRNLGTLKQCSNKPNHQPGPTSTFFLNKHPDATISDHLSF